MSGSQTQVVAATDYLYDKSPANLKPDCPSAPLPPLEAFSFCDNAARSIRENEASTSAVAQHTVERWNYPKRNMWGILATFTSFLVLGFHDATPGALIPYLIVYYDVTYTVVSLIFLAPFVGYSAAALANNGVHRRLGQRGIAIISSTCHIITFLTFSLHPPWPVLVVFCICSGFGNGLLDAGWCAWTGNMAGANRIQGVLQSFYSLGATISPLIATSMITKFGLPWYAWYYAMTGAAVVELICCTWAFWNKTGARYRAEDSASTASSSLREAFSNRVTIICALFFLFYVGAEVALGGWIVTFMLRERHGSSYASGISATGFWAGQCVGRASLGFITERYGERLCVMIYIVACLGLELVFWLVPQFVVSAVAVALLGFFMGPLFPAGVVMCAKLLPKHLHVSALGSATAIAGVGGAGVPFAVGAIAQAKGVWVLQPIVFSLIVIILAMWLLLPRKIKERDA